MNHRERIATVDYEIAKLHNKILSLEEMVEDKLKSKEEMKKHNFPWTLVNQLGLEQAELQIKIHQAEMDKHINEVKFLRLELQDFLDKKSQQ